MEFKNGEYIISTDPLKINFQMVHKFLSEESYWAKGISYERIVKSLNHSLCFVLLKGTEQIGFARVISDFNTSAHLCDVFVLPNHRGQGLSKWLMKTIIQYPDLQGLRRWTLSTADAHGLYRQFGFTELSKPDRFMERFDPDAYNGSIKP
jgi:GNAT superfamily N-acetyltransferase